MSQFALICPHCAAELVLPARRLLLHVEDADARAGDLLFTCMGCHRTGVADVGEDALAALAGAGVTTLELATIPLGYGAVSDNEMS
jgi:hypothetical protein